MYPMESYFRQLLDKLQVAVYIVDSQRRLVYINHATELLERMDRTRSLGRQYEDFWPVSTPDAMDCPTINCLMTGRVFTYEHIVWRTVGGEYIEAISNTFPVVDQGEIVGAMTTIESIKGMKRKILLEEAFQRKTATIPHGPTLTNGTTFTVADIVTATPEMEALVDKLRGFSREKRPVLISGEPGLGKLLYAQSLHNLSPWQDAPFLAVDCSEISPELLAGTVFGTGNRRGALERAQMGTVFFDNLQAMPLALQQQLHQAMAGDLACQIIAGISKPWQESVNQKLLDGPLAQQLACQLLPLAPLRGRRADIEALVHYFVKTCNRELGRSVSVVTENVLQLFSLYRWPGNVRELSQVVAKAVSHMEEGDMVLDIRHIPEFMISQICNNFFTSDTKAPVPEAPLEGGLDAKMLAFERQLLESALKQADGKMATAARLLEISRQSLYQKMKRHGITSDP